MSREYTIDVLGGQRGSIGGEEHHIKEVCDRLSGKTRWRQAPPGWVRKQIWSLRQWSSDADVIITNNDIGVRTAEPHLHVMHSSWYGVHQAWGASRMKTAIKTFPEKVSMRDAEIIIAVSKPLKEEIIENYPIDGDNIMVVENGVDKGLFRPEKNAAQEEPVLGVLSHRKGKGEKFVEGISQQLKKDGIQHQLKKAQNIPFDDMPSWYNSLNLLLHPSRYDGFGTAVAEAIACGTPVIASENTPADFTGVRKVALSDREQWIGTIKDVIKNQPTIKPDEVNSWDDVAQEYYSLITEVIGNG